MGRKPLNLKGQRFGRLVALKIVGRRDNSILWRCRCDCGSMTDVIAHSLHGGFTHSCGCLQREMAAATQHPKTPKREKAVALYLAGQTSTVIATELGLSTERVCQYLRGVVNIRAEQRKRTERHHSEVAQVFRNHATRVEAAGVLGITVESARTFACQLRKAGASIPKLRTRPSGPTPKTRQILDRFRAGESIEAIAADLGMKPNTVRQSIYMHMGTTRRGGRNAVAAVDTAANMG